MSLKYFIGYVAQGHQYYDSWLFSPMSTALSLLHIISNREWLLTTGLSLSDRNKSALALTSTQSFSLEEALEDMSEFCKIWPASYTL